MNLIFKSFIPLHLLQKFWNVYHSLKISVSVGEANGWNNFFTDDNKRKWSLENGIHDGGVGEHGCLAPGKLLEANTKEYKCLRFMP